MQLQQEKQIAKLNLLRKCGLLAHTSAAFLKNCCTEKLLVACGSYPTTYLNHKQKTDLQAFSASPFFQPLIEQLFFFQSYCPQLQPRPTLPEQFLQPIQHGYNDIKPPSLLHKLPAL